MKKSGFLFAPEYIREKVYFGVFADAFKMDVISNSALQFVAVPVAVEGEGAKRAKQNSTAPHTRRKRRQAKGEKQKNTLKDLVKLKLVKKTLYNTMPFLFFSQ